MSSMQSVNYNKVRVKFIPTIRWIVQKYPEIYWEDLEQESYIALYHACLGYDPSRSLFKTYAVLLIKSACSKYMRDKASLIRIPARKYEDSYPLEIKSLDEKILEDATLESVFGVPSEESVIDSSLYVWGSLKRLAEREIISWKDFSLLYFRYFQQWSFQLLSENYGSSPQVLSNRIGRVIQRIRPYFLRQKVI